MFPDKARIARIDLALSRADAGHTVGDDTDHGYRSSIEIMSQAAQRATERGESIISAIENAIDFGA